MYDMKKGKTNRMILELDRNELHGNDCTVAVVRALRACAEQGIRELRFPKGTYRFRPEKAFEQHYFITNHDQGGTRKTAFPIISLQGLTIDGAGSEFLFEGPMIPFVIEGSSDVTLRNMTIDWVRPMFEQGVVVEAADDSFLVRITEGVPYKAVDGRLFFEFGGRMEPVWGLHDIDPATKAHAYQSGDRISWSSFRRLRIDEVEPRLFRVSGELRHVPMIGHIVTMRFGRRENPGIFLKDSAGVRIENVTLHHAPGMGLVAQRCADIRLDRFDVRLREGSERVVTATADATHFTGCRGPIIVERCLFENQLDDPLNVHGIYAKIVERVSDRVLLVMLIHDMQKGVDIAGPGDTLQFVRCDSLLGYGQAVVESAVRLNGDYAAITFSEPLPDSIVLQDVVENVTWCPDLKIRECTVRANRARGFLITTPGSVLVEDNRISAPGAGIKISGDANSWFESGAVRDVTIRRNVFGDCNYCCPDWGRAVIDIDPEIESPDAHSACYHRNIRITDNVFETFDTALVYGHSVDGFVFSRNRIRKSGSYPRHHGSSYVVELQMVKHADVSGNEVEDGDTDAARIGSEVVSVRTGMPLEAEAGSSVAGSATSSGGGGLEGSSGGAGHTASSREA